jgi:hypothetical protein
MIKLGSKVKDTITCFGGVVTGFVTYISGCNQALVVPEVGKEGTFKRAKWFDEQRLEIDQKFIPIKLNNGNIARGRYCRPQTIVAVKMNQADLLVVCDSLNDECCSRGQSKLARRLSWHHITVWRKLSGISKISISNAWAIRKALEKRQDLQ